VPGIGVVTSTTPRRGSTLTPKVRAHGPVALTTAPQLITPNGF